jgi:hypothetical protein
MGGFGRSSIAACHSRSHLTNTHKKRLEIQPSSQLNKTPSLIEYKLILVLFSMVD